MYDTNNPLETTFAVGSIFSQTATSAIFICTIVFFIVSHAASVYVLTDDDVREIDDVITYPAALLATLFSFSLGLFMNNCYTRFKDNWMSAMKGWSRLNDLGLQIFAYVADRELACDVIRLMHAANHLCYADFAGFNAIELCRRRHLLTEREVRLLSLRNGPAPFYLCSCWALEKLAKAPNLKETYVLAMDRSVREWRQNTTLLPLMQLTPLPLPYYRVMVALLILFEFVVGLKMAIGVEHYEHESWWWAAELLSFLLFALISLVAQSLILVSIQVIASECF